MWWGIGHQLRKLASGRPERQISAARALGKSRDPRALRPLFDVLAGPGVRNPVKDAALKHAALKALTGYRDPKSLEFFVIALGDADYRKAKAATEVLEAMKCPEAIPLLLRALDDANSAKVGSAAKILAAMKCRDAIPPLLSALRENRETDYVPRALVELEAFGPLTELLHSGPLNGYAMHSLVDACKDSRNPLCVELLLPLVRSPEEAIAYAGGEATRQGLMRPGAEREFQDLRRDAVQAIAAAGGEAARQGLMRILPELDFEGLMRCVPALHLSKQEWLSSELRIYYQIHQAYYDPRHELDSGCTEKLLAILQSDKESVRGRALAASRLGRNLNSRTVSALREIMRAGVPGVWRKALREAEDGLDRLLLALCHGNLNKLDATAKAAIPSLPSTIVESLIQEDPYGATKVIEELEQNDWKPRTPGETAVYHILRKEWNQLAATGQACIEPLLELADSDAFDDETRRAAASALEEAVERLHAELPESTLRYLLCLRGVERIEEEVGTEIKIYIYFWTTMKDCIQRELERRGLKP